jgi:hypothetical protein
MTQNRNPYVYEDNFISSYLENASSNDMAVDGSSTAVTFSYAPPATKKLVAGRIILYVSGATPFSDVKFADLTALTNGVSVHLNDTEIENWKDNADMVTTFYDADGRVAFTNADRNIAGRWTFTRATGAVADGLQVTSSFKAIVQDDLTGLSVFRIKIQGVLIPTG